MAEDQSPPQKPASTPAEKSAPNEAGEPGPNPAEEAALSEAGEPAPNAPERRETNPATEPLPDAPEHPGASRTGQPATSTAGRPAPNEAAQSAGQPDAARADQSAAPPGQPPPPVHAPPKGLDLEGEFTKHLEHFAQKAHVLAGLAAGGKIKPQDAFNHMASLWEHLVHFGRELDKRAPEVQAPRVGLSSREAADRLREYGLNQAVAEKRVTIWHRLWDSVKNPLVILLAVLGVVALVTKDVRTAVIIFSMAVLSVALKVFQEAKSDKAAQALKRMVHTTATVMRDGARQEIPLARVVPGDVVLLSAGDMIPADVQLLRSKDLHINQAMLTGEALPVEKRSVEDEGRPPPEVPPDGPPLSLDEKPLDKPGASLDDPTMCFMGTNAVSGSATALVVATGSKTYFGGIAAKLSEAHEESDFDKGIRRFTMLMLRFMMFMVPFVFFVNGYLKDDWRGALLFALAVAVGLTPEMLPMVVTVCLSKGALAMSRRKVIVKRLDAIQNFGAVDVLCTDKTGTLTQDKILLEKHLNVLGEEDHSVLEYACANSHFQTGLKSAIDVAVLESGQHDPHKVDLSRFDKIDEVPFDFKRRRMSVVVTDKASGKSVLICKGAAEEVFQHSVNCADKDGGLIPLDAVHVEAMHGIVRKLNEDGFRVVALGYKDVDGKRRDFGVADEGGLTLMGYLAFLDPPKESAAQALRALADHGITPKILTGDNPEVTANICRKVKLDFGDRIVLGDELASMSKEALHQIVETHHVFAKLDPMQKHLIVGALRENGHVVGYLGDGINDAPALKAADVGISVDTAVDVAKESADIILLEKSLAVLESGVMEGRKVFANITKYIRMGASSNFGNMFSVLGASAFLPFLPMLPIQILINNLMYDFSQAAMPTDNVDDEFLSRPRRWRIDDIQKYILTLGPISSIFDYVTFFVMLHVFHAWDNAALFQTGWFVESLLSQTLIVHVIRTDKIPFFQSNSSLFLGLTTLAICLIGLWLPFSPFAGSFGLVAPPQAFWGLLALIIFCYMCLTQVVKTWLIRHFQIGSAAAPRKA